MVNLEELLENGKKEYTSPVLCIKKISFADIIVTSPTGNEAGVAVANPGEVDLGELEDGGE